MSSLRLRTILILQQGNTDIIKAVTAGDWVTGRDLYKNLMKFRPFAKHYLAMNKVPIITDHSHGMWRRILVIEFPRTFSEEEMDRDLEGKLIRELSGIFNWALEGYRRLRQKNFRLEESQSMKLMKQDYRSEMDSVRAFANGCLIKTKDSKDRLKFGSTYEMYVAFCQDDGQKEYEKKNGFRKGLKDLGYRIEGWEPGLYLQCQDSGGEAVEWNRPFPKVMLRIFRFYKQ